MGITKEERDRIKSRTKALYLASNYTQSQLSELSGTTEKSVAKWIKEEQWEQEKLARTITTGKLLEQSYLQLQAINEHIFKNNNVPTKVLSDAKAQCIREIELFKDKPLHIIIDVLQDMLRFYGTYSPKDLKAIADYFERYIKHKQNN